jgi:hypothetical protein
MVSANSFAHVRKVSHSRKNSTSIVHSYSSNRWSYSSSIRICSIHFETIEDMLICNVKVSLHLTNPFTFAFSHRHIHIHTCMYKRMSDLLVRFPIESPYKWKRWMCTFVVILEINENISSTCVPTRVQMRMKQTIDNTKRQRETNRKSIFERNFLSFLFLLHVNIQLKWNKETRVLLTPYWIHRVSIVNETIWYSYSIIALSYWYLSDRDQYLTRFYYLIEKKRKRASLAPMCVSPVSIGRSKKMHMSVMRS